LITDTHTEALLDPLAKEALERVGGIVFILTLDLAVAWTGIQSFLQKKSYEPANFRSDLRRGNPRAMDIAKELEKEGRRMHGDKTSIGFHENSLAFQRLEIGERGVGVRGSMTVKGVLVS